MRTSRTIARQRSETAFTLLEVLLVLGVLGLMAGLIAMRLGDALPSQRLKAAGRQIASTVTWVRAESIGVGQPMAIRYDVQKGQYWIAQAAPGGAIPATVEPDVARFRMQTLPDGVHFEDMQLAGAPAATGVATVPFTFLGACAGHVIHLADADGDKLTVEVMPLAAQVNLYDSRKESLDATAQ